MEPLLLFWRKSFQQHALIRTTMVLQVVEFSGEWVGTKLERFLPRNQHTQRKWLNFRFWINGKLSSSAKIWLSKSIFYANNHTNLSVWEYQWYWEIESIWEHIFCYWHFISSNFGTFCLRLESIHIWRQLFWGYLWLTYLPCYPYYISLFSKIRFSLTYLYIPKYLKIWPRINAPY